MDRSPPVTNFIPIFFHFLVNWLTLALSYSSSFVCVCDNYFKCDCVSRDTNVWLSSSFRKVAALSDQYLDLLVY